MVIKGVKSLLVNDQRSVRDDMSFQNKKQENQKRFDLMKAAMECFSHKGVNATAISEIVKRAGVGKGTFYLYFHDKYDIAEQLTLKISQDLIRNAVANVSDKIFDNLGDLSVGITEQILNQLEENPRLLKILNKNLSLGLYRKMSDMQGVFVEIEHVIEAFVTKAMEEENYERDDARRLLWMLTEWIGSIAYTAIIEGDLKTMNSLKPSLYLGIRRLIDNHYIV
jgi:AcrR family transcriptional regulator